jgi:hypothetical protein
MKKLVIFLALSIYALFVFSQEDIKSEILSYSDSTEIIIRNGRKLIIDKLTAGDYTGANNTLNYLKENTDKRYIILYPGEALLFSLATRNFPLFLYNAKNFNTLLEGKTKSVAGESMVIEMREYLSTEMPFITDELEQYQMSEVDKKLIRIYIRYYMNEDLADLNTTIRNYQKTYPGSEYSCFLNELKKLTTTARMNFVFGYGNEFLNGDIAEVFTNRLHVLNMEIDGFINQLYLSFFIGGSVSQVRSNIDLPVKKKDWIHTKEEKVSSLKYGMKIGRTIFSNQRLNVYPYLSIGGYEMNSQSSEFENKDSANPKNNLTGSFFAGFGAASDIVLKKWEPKSIYEPGGFVFFRPQIGYDQFLSNKNHTKGHDFHFMLSVGISLGSL